MEDISVKDGKRHLSWSNLNPNEYIEIFDPFDVVNKKYSSEEKLKIVLKSYTSESIYDQLGHRMRKGDFHAI